jgi:hypothetical protein
MNLPERNPFRTGDAIRFLPNGETWLVAYCRDGYVCCCGWPESLAKVENCELVEFGTNEECEKLLQQMAEMRPDNGYDSRKSYAVGFLEREAAEAAKAGA